ncbi:MAG: hypothetical protein LBH03_01240 [Holophagales bacterium]|jgi:hypothetical protein|nr:hypothetical protein [Holophagales bacterium]
MPTLTHGIKLGTAVWKDGFSERRALVACLPGDVGRVVDINRIERIRLAKLGEGRAEAVADALVPSSLRQLLESGPHGFQRAAQALSYAYKWHQKTGLPEEFAPFPGSYKLLPCLPRPLAVRTSLGHFLDRLTIQGPRAILPAISEPTIAIVGSTEEKYAGCCIAANSPIGPIIGAWLYVGQLPQCDIFVEIGTYKNSTSTDIWADLTLPSLRPAEVFLLPAPMLRLPNNISPKDKITIETSFDRLEINYGSDPVHPTVQ